MKGIWIENQILQFRDDLPVPRLSADEALVRVRLAGICGTDLQLLRGYHPFTGIPGHEFVGEVTQAEGWSSLIGKRVVGEITVSCGECRDCRAGRSRHCHKRSVLGILNRNGAFAEYVALPAGNLHVVPDQVPDEMAVFTEPLAAAIQITKQVSIGPKDSVLVIGAGRLGQLIAQTLQLKGCKLQVVARHAEQVALLRTRGITSIPETELPTRSMDVVVEATGSPGGLTLARRSVRPCGIIVLKSTYAGDVTLNLSGIVVDEVTLVGSRCGPFAEALRMLEEVRVDPTCLIRGRYGLWDAMKAFEHAQEPAALKVLLDTAKE